MKMERYFLLAVISVLIILVLVLILKLVRQKKTAMLLSSTDPISGALNGYGFEQEAKRYIDKQGNEYSLVLLQFSNLNQIIHTFGTTGKEEVLRHLVLVLKSNLSNMEPVARISDDLFGFLMRNQQKEEIQARLQRIYDEANRFNQGRQDPYRLDLEFAVCPSEQNASVSELLEKARSVFEDPGNETRYHFYKKSVTSRSEQKKLLLSQIDGALKNGDFVPYLQPKVRLGDRRVIGADVSIRWKHQQLGLLTSEMFLPILEEYHMIHRLHLNILELVCKRLSQWKKLGWMDCMISLNLSIQDLEIDNFFDHCNELCRAYDIPESWIEFELPECLYSNNSRKLSRIVDEIRLRGFRCALSEFGKNRIPLHILHEVSVDTIKLDHRFFRMENNDRQNRFLIEAILKVAAQMHIQTVAEGIDNSSQVQYLQQVGCVLVQGHCFFAPMTLDEFETDIYQDGTLRYLSDEASQPQQAEQEEHGGNMVLFSYYPEEDRVAFSSLFSPVLEGQLVCSNAEALLRSSSLIHENDRKDFLKLVANCRKDRGWVKNTFRVYTSKGHYEWLEVYLHMEQNSAGMELITGALANTIGWKNEVSRWKEQADRDALTGLYNRKYFEYSSAATLDEDDVNSAAIVFLDVDDFKRVNDTLGHIVGDDVLRSVAKKMLGVFRHTDVVARYGGDEFVVFVNGIGRADLEKRLKQLCQIFSYPYRNGDITYKVSGSIGAAMYPEDGISYRELLDHADTALYTAKSRGKDQFVFYEKGMIPERK